MIVNSPLDIARHSTYVDGSAPDTDTFYRREDGKKLYRVPLMMAFRWQSILASLPALIGDTALIAQAQQLCQALDSRMDFMRLDSAYVYGAVHVTWMQARANSLLQVLTDLKAGELITKANEILTALADLSGVFPLR